MVIEHVDDRQFVSEIHRVLRPQGIALISSVVKRKWAWYFYKNEHGERVLGPTHLREYKSIAEFTRLFQSGFDLIDVQTTQCAPLIEPFFRTLFVRTRNTWFRDAPTKNQLFRALRYIRVPIPGYYSIEIIVRKH